MDKEAVANHLHRVLPDYLEGYLVIGRHAATNELIARYHGPTQEAVDDMNAVLGAIVAAGGLKFEGAVIESPACDYA
jgi:hypothetical protein